MAVAGKSLWKRGDSKAFWLIFFLGSLVRLIQIVSSQPHPGREFTELELTARSLIIHGTLGNPYLHETGPSAHVAPLVPLLFGFFYAVFGMDALGQVVQRFAGALAASAQYALLPAAAEALGVGRLVGVAAGLFGALIPYKGYIETVDAVWEQPYTALVLVLLFLHTVRIWKDTSSISTASAALRGVFWGFAILLSPTFLPIFGFVLLYEFLVTKRRAGLVAVIVCAVLVQVPWIARNWVQLGGFVPMRSNFALEFNLSNRPGAQPLMEENVAHGSLAQFHPSHNVQQWQELRDKGEIAYNREKLAEARGEIARDPRRFLLLTGQRIWRFWWWPSLRRNTMMVTGLITLLGILGLRMLPPTHARNLLGLILLAYPLVYYLIEVDRRYRYPIEWIFTLCAAFAVLRVLGAGSLESTETPSEV